MSAAILSRRSVLAAAALGLAGCRGGSETITGGFLGQAHERGHLLRTTQQGSGSSAIAPKLRRCRVLILGAGISGLAAARRLHEAGIEDFALLDLEDEIGGNCRATSLQGLNCPMGAHYLPVPGEDAGALLDLLEQIGLRRRVAGRWVYDERHLCHSPQERLFFRGHWQDGLLPLQGVTEATLRQYQKFAHWTEQLRIHSRFTLPAAQAPADASSLLLDLTSFEVWLQKQGLDDPQLRWYLDYCCRDEYGAGIDVVSAWAGLHYFASRHGFSLPQAGQNVNDAGLLTWPEGNNFLVRALAAPWQRTGGERQQGGRTVTGIRALRHEVEVDVWRHADAAQERWSAPHCIVALPMFVARRLLPQAPALLQEAVRRSRYSAWLVANLHLREALDDRPGAAPSWDNVIFDAPAGSLGYVDAGHQKLDPRPGPTVLSHYRALGIEATSRQRLLQRSWIEWKDEILADLSLPHPDLPSKLTRIDMTRYGHAMIVPRPGLQAFLRQALAGEQQTPTAAPRGKGRPRLNTPVEGRLLFAHSDWSGYSIFEEAFARGDAAASLLAG